MANVVDKLGEVDELGEGPEVLLDRLELERLLVGDHVALLGQLGVGLVHNQPRIPDLPYVAEQVPANGGVLLDFVVELLAQQSGRGACRERVCWRGWSHVVAESST